jgi:hypothetical protein
MLIYEHTSTRPWAVNRAEATKPPHRFAEGKPMVLRDGRGLDHAQLVFAFASTARNLGE